MQVEDRLESFLAKMTTEGFSVESMIRGYHEYKSIWENPSVGESLICEQEVRNCYDTHAMAIKKNIEGDIKTVGHIPRKISSICSIFIRHGGSIVCLVDGSHRYRLICRKRLHTLGPTLVTS